MMNKIIWQLLLLQLPILAIAQNNDAIQPVTYLHQSLITVMQDQRDVSERLAFLEPIIQDNFDMPVIARVVSGRYWKTFSPDQQQQFIDILHQLSVQTYINQFDHFSDERFEYLESQNIRRNRQLIKTQLVRLDAPPISLDYLVHHSKDGAWRIISVIAEGVNDLSLRRTEYNTVLKDQGWHGLIAAIQKKIDNYNIKHQTKQ